ncbi:polysaccharide pyruvyl transferase family protein [Alteromonas macleodii]|uniref:polysaccharide pyruvyl transferase family protein n=1 Tax=Alteromonas macleodii TaxID=28108 RepID=UPI0001AEBB00|nr:polysaccharide pyruvyl transferase family protein [Alteromonas macleodii]AFS38147.1 hypothetical protein MASE_13175 [Alteromonas macleodii ATCC 27126]
MKSKINVGILNLQHSNFNYGAVLQAAALENALGRLGFNAMHINFVPQIEPTPPSTIRDYIGAMFRLLFSKSLLTSLKGYLDGAGPFIKFRKKNLTLTNEVNSNDDFIKLCEEFDIVIVGSDQVWRVRYTKPFEMSYFLKGVHDSVKRVAYAASFGVDFWEAPEIVSSVSKELSKFSAISVRERSGASICKEKFSLNSEHVLDPTLLVGSDYFFGLINDKLYKSSGIAYYKLDMSAEFKKSIELLSINKGCQQTNIYYDESLGKRRFREVSEWLSSIYSAKVVVTDSYHCICLSIIFEKDFICIANEKRGITRLASLLESLELEDRICFDDNDLVLHYQKLSPIDYKRVSASLDKMRVDSFEYLQSSLEL